MTLLFLYRTHRVTVVVGGSISARCWWSHSIDEAGGNNVRLPQQILLEICPRCETGYPLEIVYGFASAEMFDSALAGHIALGGCTFDDDSPAYRCRRADCETEWGRWGDFPD